MGRGGLGGGAQGQQAEPQASTQGSWGRTAFSSFTQGMRLQVSASEQGARPSVLSHPVPALGSRPLRTLPGTTHRPLHRPSEFVFLLGFSLRVNAMSLLALQKKKKIPFLCKVKIRFLNLQRKLFIL